MNVFDTINFQTQQGAEIKAMLQRRIAEYRSQNDDINRTPLDTAVLRGRIAELNALLSIAPQQVKMASYYDSQEKTQ